MVNRTVYLAIAGVLSCAACRDDYRLRVEVIRNACAFKEVTSGRESELIPAGISAEFERHSNSFAGTSMTFEVTCGTTTKRYTIAGTSCEEGCRIRSESCDVESLIGETAQIDVGTSGEGSEDFYYVLRYCEFDTGQRLPSIGPGPIPPD
jgi:hypothetical protein